MSQIQTGTCNLTYGGQQVVAGDNNVDWSEAQEAISYGTPVFFCLIGSVEIPRQVVNATPPNLSDSGLWELTLIAPWEGDDVTAAPYIIHTDFTTNLGLPIVATGDKQTAQLWARMVQILDTNWPPAPTTSPPALAGGTKTTIAAGSTLYSGTEIEIPATSEIEIMPGGVIEIG